VRSVRGEQGSAIVEVAALAPLLVIPVLFFALTVHRAEQARLAAATGARDAARAYATATDDRGRPFLVARGDRGGLRRPGLPGARLDITFAREPGARCSASSVTAPVLVPGDAVLVCVAGRGRAAVRRPRHRARRAPGRAAGQRPGGGRRRRPPRRPPVTSPNRTPGLVDIGVAGHSDGPDAPQLRSRRGDDGTVMLLTLGLTALVLGLVLTVADAGAVFVARRELASTCDGAATAAAQAVDVPAVYAGTQPRAAAARPRRRPHPVRPATSCRSGRRRASP